MITYMVLAGAFTVYNLWSLDDVFRGDVGMALNRLQGQTVRLPCRKIIRAVYANTTTLFLALNLVLAEPEELARLLVHSDTARVRIHKGAVSSSPSRSWNDPLGGGSRRS